MKGPLLLEDAPSDHLDTKGYNMGAGEGEEVIYPVEVRWLGDHRRGLLTDEHPGVCFGTPVVVFDGAPHATHDLEPDATVIFTWHRKQTHPMTGAQWGLIERAIDAGYPVRVAIAD